MFTIEQRVTVHRPIEDVFAFLAEPANIPRWRPDVLETRNSAPLQLGSQFDEVINFGGRKSQTFRVTAYDPDATLEVTAVAGLGIRPTQRYSLARSTAGTDVAIHVEVRTQGAFRLLEPLLPKMIAGKWSAYAQALRERIEAQPTASAYVTPISGTA
jgi:uncharacterized protein YndB with AHSA1/START domain